MENPKINPEWEQDTLLISSYKKNKDSNSLRQLLFKYEPLFKALTNKYHKAFKTLPLDEDDFLNILKQRFEKLVLEYDPNKGMAFSNYIKTFLQYNLITYLKGFATRAHDVMNYCSSYQENNIKHNPEPVTEMTLNSKVVKLEKLMKKADLSSIEELVIREYVLKGKSMNELSVLLRKDLRTLYYIKNTAQKKIKRQI